MNERLHDRAGCVVGCWLLNLGNGFSHRNNTLYEVRKVSLGFPLFRGQGKGQNVVLVAETPDRVGCLFYFLTMTM